MSDIQFLLSQGVVRKMWHIRGPVDVCKKGVD